MVVERRHIHHRRSPCGARHVERGAGRVHHRVSRRPVEVVGGRLFFCGRISQHMERSRAGDWLAGAAMLLAAASWGLVAALLS